MGIGVYESSQYVAGARRADRRSTARPDAGTRVRVLLPAGDGAAPRRRRHAKDVGMNETRKPLLIVEDDPALQKQMQLGVRPVRDGASPPIARSRSRSCAATSRPSSRWISACRRDPDDPDAKGFTLLEEIHALAPDTKVIVLTGQNDRANALQGDRARRATTSARSRSSPSS